MAEQSWGSEGPPGRKQGALKERLDLAGTGQSITPAILLNCGGKLEGFSDSVRPGNVNRFPTKRGKRQFGC